MISRTARPILPTALLVSGLLAVACCASEPTPTEAPMQTPQPAVAATSTGLLVEVHIDNGMGPGIGYRIFGDGRYETLQGDDEVEWTEVRRLDADELATYRGVMAGLNLAGLDDAYPGSGAMDGATTTWRIVVDGKLRTIEVGDETIVDDLETLWEVLPPVLTTTVVTTEWRVLRDGTEQAYPLSCGTDEIAEIDALTRAMATGTVATAGPDADSSRFLTVLWQQDGVEINRQEVWSDGWQLAFKGDKEILRKQYGEAEIAAIRQALAAVPWDDLKGRCP